MRKKKLLVISGILLLLVLSCIVYCNKKVEAASVGKLYDDVSTIPYNKVGLLLGTGKLLKNGHLNPYYLYRINAAVELIKANKIKYIIISGDNSRKEYDEPTTMRADLINAGIDSTIIYLDYAGFRTFDSMIRAKKIFGQDSLTIISQQFHNERALYIASQEGMNAIAFNAKGVSSKFGFRVQLREKFARVKVFLDYLFSKQPKFLGTKVTIPA
ncbi:SanA/YdcF family protein [Ferruginibacter albus]|uniref:SanA/YdcF family protein n=1 Tax=Ferruginibacter albus TaxID=2875540 RepID=UPI001CC5CA05|nr:ElyC/SanA/YdcF family protein [Ferruginibacter albus]UAY53268.1 YdcF family protein [Ferruginibacter albus]